MREPPVSYERWVDTIRRQTKDVDEPRHLEMIDCFVEHMVSERSGDVDRFMRTMIDEPIYRSWGRSRPVGVSPFVRDGEQIRRLYEDMMLYRPGGFPQFEMDIQRFWVGDDGLAMDGVLHRLARADELDSLGETRPDGSVPDAEYVVSRRAALFVSFRNGRMVGEDMYYDSSSTVAAVSS